MQPPVQESRSRIGDTGLHNALSRRSGPTVCIVDVNYKAHRLVQVTTVPMKINRNHEAPNGLDGYQPRNMDPEMCRVESTAEGTRLRLPIPLSPAEAQVAS